MKPGPIHRSSFIVHRSGGFFMRSALVLAALLTTSVLAQPSADDLAKRTIAAQAGSAWEKARYFAFTFDVDRGGQRVASFPQRWDRYTGDYRVSGKDQQGRNFLVIMNTNTKKGQAWINFLPAKDEQLEEMLTLGYRRFINDTYWLLMPLKMLDPGVHRAYEGEKVEGGKTYDVLHLSFDTGVGLTSSDQYWAWINRDGGLVEQWQMKLQGSKPEDAPLVVLFHDFKRVGGLKISTSREVVGKNQTVRLDDLEVSSDVPKDAFAAP
jgi:hypothetical protein